MTRRPLKIGIAGTHSTGKSTLAASIRRQLEREGMRVGQVDDLAARARTLGFPILTEHTYESTLWIMADGMRQEAEQALVSDVIIVDRPVPDAFAYLLAALEISGRKIETRRLKQLEAIAAAHVPEYDILVVTVLDTTYPLGPGRDTNQKFRELAAEKVSDVMSRHASKLIQMTSMNSGSVLKSLVDACMDRERQH